MFLTFLLLFLEVSIKTNRNKSIQLEKRTGIFFLVEKLTDLMPLSIYFTSCEIKQLNCRKFSLIFFASSSGASLHFISISNEPPKN